MANQTPERALKLSRWWAAAAVVLIALRVPAGMLGFEVLALPLMVFALVCFYAAGDHSGWADGWKAAKADESPNALVSIPDAQSEQEILMDHLNRAPSKGGE